MELMKMIISKENLNQAYKRVVANKGASGVDGITVDELESHIRENGKTIINSLKNKTYSPMPVRRVYIPKSNEKKRPLGIPTVLDRTIQQAIAQPLTYIYEGIFSEFSYGFRPNRSCHDAIKQALKYLNEGYEWIIDIDIEQFFDKVNHDKLIQILREQIKDSSVLSKIVRPMKSKYLGFTFLKYGGQWNVKPTKEKKVKLYEVVREYLKRGKTVARPLEVTFKRINQIVVGWINYFRIGVMTRFMKETGSWLRHKIRVIILKQWKRPRAIHKNLPYINNKYNNGFDRESIFKVANSRLGLYKTCAMNVVNFILNPKLLETKIKGRVGLLNPLKYYLRNAGI